MIEIKKSRVEEITVLQAEVERDLRQTLQKVFRIGELLTEQKGNLKHGEFTKWVEDNLPSTDRTARNYMRAYKNRDKLKTENVSDLGATYRLMLEAPKNEIVRSPYEELGDLKRHRDDLGREANHIIGEQLVLEQKIGRIITKLKKKEQLDKANAKLQKETDMLLKELPPIDSKYESQHKAWREKAEALEIDRRWDKLFKGYNELGPEYSFLIALDDKEGEGVMSENEQKLREGDIEGIFKDKILHQQLVTTDP